MKILFENWKRYLNKEKKEISSKEELRSYIEKNPSETLPTNITIENPAGTLRTFMGAKETKLPFDYGELPNIINTSDNMGWDIILVPGSNKTSQNLKLVGHAEYADGSGNDKIILANGGAISSDDKEIISKFFEDLEGIFKDVEWY